MANPVKGVTRLRPEPYDPDAQDGDGDGIVQERTAWERPVGTRILDINGDPIARGRSLTERPNGLQIVDKNGKKVNYRPSYSPEAEPGGAGGGAKTPLSDQGVLSLAEMGLPTLRSINAPAPPQTSPVEPSKTPDPAPPSTKLPDPPKKPRNPSLAPFDGRAQELADQAGGDWTKFAELLNKEGYVAFDYETTGFDDGNIPVQVGAVRVKDGKIVERLNLFMNPQRGLSQWSKDNLLDANGQPLTDEWLAGQQSIEEAHRQLVDFLGDSILVAQYIPFDEEVLTRTLKELGIDYTIRGKIDTKELGAQILPKGDGTTGPIGHSLKDLSDFLGVRLDNWHTADADSAAAARVLMGTLEAARDRNADPNILDGEWQKARYAERVAQHAVDMNEYRRKKEEYDRLVQQGYDIAPTDRIPPQAPAPDLEPSSVLDNPQARQPKPGARFSRDVEDGFIVNDSAAARQTTRDAVRMDRMTVNRELDEVSALLEKDPLAAYMGGDDQFVKTTGLAPEVTERGRRLNSRIRAAGKSIREDFKRRFGPQMEELEKRKDAADKKYQEAWEKIDVDATSRHEAGASMVDGLVDGLPPVVEGVNRDGITVAERSDLMAPFRYFRPAPGSSDQRRYDTAVDSIPEEHTVATHKALMDAGLVEDGKVRLFLDRQPVTKHASGFLRFDDLHQGSMIFRGQRGPGSHESGDAIIMDVPLEDIRGITTEAGKTELHFRRNPENAYLSTRAKYGTVPLASLGQAMLDYENAKDDALAAREAVRNRIATGYRIILDEVRGVGPRIRAEGAKFESVPGRNLPGLKIPGTDKWDRPASTSVSNDIRSAFDFLPTDWVAAMSRTPIRVENGDRGMYASLVQEADGTWREARPGEAPQISLLRLPRLAEDGRARTRFEKSTIMHELTHMAEEHIPEIKLVESSFVAERNNGAVPTMIGAGETGYPDEFFSSYAGRVYGGGAQDNYEVLAMGMQAIFAPESSVHVEFLDEEYLDWTIGVLATVGRRGGRRPGGPAEQVL